MRVELYAPGNWDVVVGESLAELTCDTNTVGGALEWLVAKYPILRQRLYIAGEERLASWVNVFLGDDNIRDLNGLDTILSEPTSIITIVHAVAGGS